MHADYLYDAYGNLDSDFVFVNLWCRPHGLPMTGTRSRCAGLAGVSGLLGDRRGQPNDDSARITGQVMYVDVGVMSALSVNMYNTIMRSKGLPDFDEVVKAMSGR